MKSLPKVIKRAGVTSAGKVQIPDSPPRQEAESEPEEAVVQDIAAAPEPPPRRDPENAARERAEEVAKKILQSAHLERQKILQQASAEAEEIRRRAAEEGACRALEEKRAEVDQCLREVEGLLRELQEEQEQFLAQYERELPALALEIAGKILNTTLSNQEGMLLPLVEEAVLSVKNAEWIRVEVSERLPELIGYLRTILEEREQGVQVEVAPAELPEDGCIIHTPEGVIDASVSTQLENLKAIFQNLDR